VQYTAWSYTFWVPVLVWVSDGFGVSIAKATTNKVVVAWGIWAGWGDFNCSTYTFVWTVATLWTTGVLFNWAGLQVKRLQQHSCTLDTNKVVFSYVLQSWNLVAFKVVDTSVWIVFWTQQSISWAYNLVNTSSLATVSTTKFIQQHILWDFTGSFSVFTVSWTTITLVWTYPYPTWSFSWVNRIGIWYIWWNRAISIRIPTVASSAIAISLFDVSGSPVLIDYLLFTAQTAVWWRIWNVCTLWSSLYVSLWDAPTVTTGTVATRFYEIKTASDKILVWEKVSINTKWKNATMQRFDFADAFIPLWWKIQYLAIKADGSGTNSNMMLGTFDTVTMNLLNTSWWDILPADVSFVIGKQIPVSYPINNPKWYFEIVNRSWATREITIQEALVLTN
jgi:hypothetical protein